MSFQYTSTRSFDSKVCPGVTVVLKKINEKRRAELMRSIAPLLDKERDILKRLGEVQERRIVVHNEDGTDKIDPETCEAEKKYASDEDLQHATDIVQELMDFRTLEVYPHYIDWGVKEIAGLEIDGRPFTIEDLKGDDAPDGFVEEILSILQGRTEIPTEKKIGESLPFTSSNQETSTNPATTASSAEAS